jgi:hypothetical protein
MPNRDKTGPEGKGPRTGRGAGNCPPNDNSNENTRVKGSTDFAIDQYSNYPKRDDSTSSEYYGRRRRRGRD